MEQFEQFTKMQKIKNYLAKWKIDGYTLQYSHKIERYVIKSGQLVCDAVYLNPFANFNQWYKPYEKNEEKKLSGLIM